MEEEEDEESNSSAGEEKAIEDDKEETLPSRSSSASTRILERPQRSPRYSDLEVREIHDGAQRIWARESLHSDSGISDMRSSSPDQQSPTLQKRLPTLPDEPWAEVDAQDAQYSYAGTYGIQASPDLSGERRTSAFRHKHWPLLEETSHDQTPGPYYARSPARMTDVAHDNVPEPYPPPTTQLVGSTSISQEVMSRAKPKQMGYELLASKLDSRGDAVLRPIYRKFETLNNRMLLYLQDEISEMEDQLRELDDAIAHDERVNGSKPASRRVEVRLPSQLQWHRLDLLGKIFAKIEQYSESALEGQQLHADEARRSRSHLLQQPHQKPRASVQRRHQRLSLMDYGAYTNRPAGGLPPGERIGSSGRHRSDKSQDHISSRDRVGNTNRFGIFCTPFHNRRLQSRAADNGKTCG